MKQFFTSAAIFAATVSAIPVWSQCGGNNWTGSGTCDSGSRCVVVNEWYHQCQPGAATTTTLATSVRTTTTSSRPVSTTTTGTVRTTTAATTTAVTTTRSGGSTTTPPPTTVSGNPFAGKQVYANPYYSSEIHTLAIPSLPASLQAKASAVAKLGTFVWLDNAAKVPTVDTYLADIKAKNAAGANPPIMGAFVVYNLPNRDCAALASNGEYQVAQDGLNKYKTYVDNIAAAIKKYPEVSIALVIEPDSLGNLITNMNVARCVEAEPAYIAGVEYAVKTLNFPNVASYIDAGHAGWLGWDANLGPAAKLFAKIYNEAGKPASLRGLVTNVSNYNAYNSSSAPAYTQGNKNYNEKLYINAIDPLLAQAGFPAHFIVDQGRSGVQPTQQQAWGNWCNVKGTGFGTRPTTDTGDALVDAIVWVKPGGESDGTSDSSATRYDAHCGYADSLTPAPEAGTWFQAYFEQLLRNASW